MIMNLTMDRDTDGDTDTDMYPVLYINRNRH
jgi:hypothetical protein